MARFVTENQPALPGMTGTPNFRRGVTEKVVTRAPGVRANKYPGTCPTCNGRVESEEGRLDNIDGKWVTSHIVCPEAPAAPAPEPVAGEIPEGRFTVEFEDGTYKTLRVKRQAEDAQFMPGVLVLGYLAGANNDSDYTSFGNVNSQGQVVIWKRHLGNRMLREAVKVLVGDVDAARTAYATQSGNCSRCGRTLTVPASLHAGLGPECSKKVG